MQVKEIVEMWLKENGYQGLSEIEYGCSCTLDDFMPCGEDPSDCHAAYKIKCKGEKCESYIKNNCESGPEEYCITVKKPDDETEIIKG